MVSRLDDAHIVAVIVVVIESVTDLTKIVDLNWGSGGKAFQASDIAP